MATTTRRRFLGWLAALCAVGALTAGSWRIRGYALPPSVTGKLRILRGWQYWVIESFAARVTHPEHADAGVFVDHYLEDLPRLERRDLLRFVAYLEHVAPMVSGRGGRFTALSPKAQDGILNALESSDIHLLRAGFQALKGLSMMALYREPVTWRAIGFPGPVLAIPAPTTAGQQ